MRVVDELEERYAQFPRLNLTFECREGILKHCSLRHARDARELGERFIRRRQPGLEAQIANLAEKSPTTITTWMMASARQCWTCRVARGAHVRRQHDAVAALYPIWASAAWCTRPSAHDQLHRGRLHPQTPRLNSR